MYMFMLCGHKQVGMLNECTQYVQNELVKFVLIQNNTDYMFESAYMLKGKMRATQTPRHHIYTLVQRRWTAV